MKDALESSSMFASGIFLFLGGTVQGLSSPTVTELLGLVPHRKLMVEEHNI
jgi:hypothetical protein